MNSSKAKPQNPWSSLGDGPVVAPSLLACDFTRVGEQIDQALAGGAGVLHVDVMDGHFVPNLSMGPAFVKSIRRYTDAPLDVHLMVTDPASFIEPFADAGASSITFHVEACDDPREIIDRLHGRGLGVGVTLRPATPTVLVESWIQAVELVLVMTVEPGYSGQRFMSGMLDRIAEIRRIAGPQRRVEVDGGITVDTARQCAQAGADVFVAGSSVFGQGDIAAAVRGLRAAASV